MVYKHIKSKRNKQTTDKRLSVVMAVFLFLTLLLVVKLFKIQVIDHKFFKQVASGQHDLLADLEPLRGQILIEDGDENSDLFPIATNRKLSLLYSIPREIEDKEKTVDFLVETLALGDDEKVELEKRLARVSDPYEPIRGGLEEEVVDRIKGQGMPGLYFSDEFSRYYPEGRLFSHLTGFLGFVEHERKGQYGIEEFFNKELTGERGQFYGQKGASGRLIAIGDNKIEEAEDGADMVLTIDRAIQFEVCQHLKDYVGRYPAESGTVIVMDAYSGQVKALCNYPNFDANKYNEVGNVNQFLNQAISLPWEPGSIFKVITMAAGLDSGAVEVDTTYEDTGSVKFGKYVIKNASDKVYGESNMTQVLENSINTGAVFVAQEVGLEMFGEYVRRFGFGELSGIKLPGEARGDLSALKKKGDIYLATASFGQGISVTPIQMIGAFAAIANGGKLMKPYVVKEIKYQDGQVEKFESQVVRDVISTKTAVTLKAMMVSVVKTGHAKNAQVDGYYVAGKTGTAQVAYADKAGYSSDTIHSFVGFAPVDKPQFVVLTKLDRPKVNAFSASTAAPLFSKIAEFLLQYYQIPPETTGQ